MKLNKNISKLDKTYSDNIECFIKEVDCEFVPPLSSRVSISEWSKKLNELAVNIGKINDDGDLEALISFYANKGDVSYISFVAVSKSQRGKKTGTALLDYCIDFCTEIGSTYVKLETWLSNERIIDVYHSRGFVDLEIKNDRSVDKSLILIKKL